MRHRALTLITTVAFFCSAPAFSAQVPTKSKDDIIATPSPTESEQAMNITSEAAAELFSSFAIPEPETPIEDMYEELLKMNRFEATHLHALEKPYRIHIMKAWTLHVLASKIFDRETAFAITSDSLDEYRKYFNGVKEESEKSELDAQTYEWLPIFYNAYCDTRLAYTNLELNIAIEKENPLLETSIDALNRIHEDKNCSENTSFFALLDSLTYRINSESINQQILIAKKYLQRKDTPTPKKVKLMAYLLWPMTVEERIDDARGVINELKEWVNSPESEVENDWVSREYVNDSIADQINEIEALESKRDCYDYWNHNETDPLALSLTAANDFVTIYNQFKKGINSTTPIKEYYNGSNDFYISEYKVDPQIYSAQSKVERALLRNKGTLNITEIRSVQSGFQTAFELINQSIDYQIKAYFLKKSNYRGEFERAYALLQESNEAFTSAITALLPKMKNHPKKQCQVPWIESFI